MILFKYILFTVCIFTIVTFVFLICLINKKDKIRKWEALFIVTLSLFSFFFFLTIALVTASQSPNWLPIYFPEVIDISDSTSFWTETLLSIVGIIVSIITAVIATFISLRQDKLTQKQDDLSQFIFESALVPLFKSNGFKFESIHNSKYELYGIKHKAPQDQSFYDKNNEAICLSFELSADINQSLNYKIESLKIYKGRCDFENIKKSVPIIELFSNIDRLELEILQKNNSYVLECLFFIKNRAKYSEDFNEFYFALNNPNMQNTTSQYTVYLTMNVNSNNPKYGEEKNLEILIRIINEAAFYSKKHKDCFFKVHSTIPAIKK